MRRRRSRAVYALILSTLLTAVVGCGHAEPGPHPEQTTEADSVRLGMLAPLTGRNAAAGKSMVNAAQLAVREANDAGGVLGRRVELVAVDDACDAGTAVDGANDLVAKHIAVSVGGYCSSATVPTLKIFRSAGVPMIVPLSNSTELLTSGSDGVFLLSGTVSAEASFAVEAIGVLGGRRLVVIHDGTSFPTALADATVEAVKAASKAPATGKAPARGGAAGATRLSVVAALVLTQGAPGYPRIVDRVVESKVDTIYFTGYYSDGHRLILDLRERGFVGRIVMGDGALDGPLLAGLTDRQQREVYATALLIPEFIPEASSWAARYRKMHGSDPGASTIEAYDAVVLALDSIRRAGTVDQAAVVKAIRQAKNVPLLSGPVKFTDDGVRINPRFLLVKARKGKFELAALG